MLEIQVKQVQQLKSSIESEITFYRKKLFSLKIKEYDTLYSSSEETEVEIKKILCHLFDLTLVLFHIRKEIKNFNSKEIDELTNKIAMYEHFIEYHEDVLKFNTSPETMKKYSSSDDKSYKAYITEMYEIEHRNIIKDLNKKIQSLKNTCSGLNSSVTISLDENSTNILKKYALI